MELKTDERLEERQSGIPAKFGHVQIGLPCCRYHLYAISQRNEPTRCQHYLPVSPSLGNIEGSRHRDFIPAAAPEI
jgi:hypothetical protein